MGSSLFVRQFLRIFGSLKLAVVTLALLSAVLVFATIYESRTSTRQVQALIYQSWWFLGLLSILALNVFCSAVARFPWKGHQTGFVITHSGILVLLAGAIWGLLLGIEGSVTLVEGGHAVQSLNRNYASLHVTEQASHRSVSIPLESEQIPPPPGHIRPFSARPLPLSVGLKAIHANTKEELLVSDGGMEVNPAARFTLTTPKGSPGMSDLHLTEWLVAGDHERRSLALGPVVLRIENVQSAEVLAQRLSPPTQEAAQGKGILNLVVRGQTVSVPVQDYLGREFKSADGKITVAVREYFADFRMDTSSRKPISVSDEPRNPAVAFEVILPEGRCSGFAFADFPEMSLVRSDTVPANTVQATYAFDRTGAGIAGHGAMNTFTVLAGPDDQLHYTSVSAHSGFQSGALKVGQSVSPGWQMAAEFKLDEYHLRPRLDKRLVSAPPAPGARSTSPALELHLEKDGTAQDVMVRWGEPRTVALAGANFELAYGMATSPLDFSIALEKFNAPKFEGTTMPASFESTVRVQNLKTDEALETRIWMNNPLTYHGYRISQASYEEGVDGAPNTSTLQFLHDPGWPLKWMGSFLIIGGIATMIFTKPPSQTQSNPPSKDAAARNRKPAAALARSLAK